MKCLEAERDKSSFEGEKLSKLKGTVAKCFPGFIVTLPEVSTSMV